MATRDRRQNAGNRMHKLLAGHHELAPDEIFQDIENDVEFEAVENEEDFFDSDFASTDEEAYGDEQEEAQIRAEERSAKRVKTSILMQRSIVTPKSATSSSKSKRNRKDSSKQRAADRYLMFEPVRKSNRASAVASKIELEEKLREADERRAMLPIKRKVEEVELTQEQLLEEAKLTEEVNLASLYHLQTLELEKKKSHKKLPTRHIGPIVRYHSFIDGRINAHEVNTVLDANPESNTVEEPDQSILVPEETNEAPVASGSFPPPANETEIGVPENNTQVEEIDAAPRSERTLITFVNFDPRQRLLGECSAPQPYPEKPICPITGEIAKYRDPKTGVPYANIKAYKTIKSLLDGDYAWSPLLRAYIHRYDFEPTKHIPKEFVDSTFGVSAEEYAILMKKEQEELAASSSKSAAIPDPMMSMLPMMMPPVPMPFFPAFPPAQFPPGGNYNFM